jgi:hypothetical protein
MSSSPDETDEQEEASLFAMFLFADLEEVAAEGSAAPDEPDSPQTFAHNLFTPPTRRSR